MSDFKAILTDLGQQLITAAYQAGEVVTITQMAFGDANQQPVTVDPAMTALINQTAILPLTRGPQAEDIIGGGIDILSSKYPDEWIYECGLFDDAGNLIIYASYPPSLVPPEVDNVKKGISIDIGLVMSSTDGITVYVDPELEALTKAVADTLYFKLDQNFAEFEDDDHGDEAKAAAREHMGLGTAATLDATTSTTDSTVGHALRVGDRGLGMTVILPSIDFDFNEYVFSAGETLFIETNSSLNFPAGMTELTNTFIYADVVGIRDSNNDCAVLFSGYDRSVSYLAWRISDANLQRSWSVIKLPTAALDVNAWPTHPTALGETNLNTLGGVDSQGAYFQEHSDYPSTDLGYPAGVGAGSLQSFPSALGGCQHEYTTYDTGVKFVRGLTGVWNGVDGPWGPWIPQYSQNNPQPVDLSAYATQYWVQANFVNAVRFGAVTQVAVNGNQYAASSGCVLSAIQDNDTSIYPAFDTVDDVYQKPLQVEVGQEWFTVAG